LLLRAQDEGIETHIVHNASIMNAAGACGLQLYNFGATVSIPFFRDDWRPDSWYPKIKYNAGGGMHTLCLLGGLVVVLDSRPFRHNGVVFGHMCEVQLRS
jgi:diphthine synthase